MSAPVPRAQRRVGSGAPVNEQPRGKEAAKTTPPSKGVANMNEELTALTTELRRFATELRSLAYTTPAGHEDKFIALSERMRQRVELRAAKTGSPR